jgi:hypothetical protein
MKKVGLVLLWALACALSGCGDLLSLHALYTKQDQVFDPAIEGRWENKDDILTVKRMGDMYEAVLQGRTPAAEAVKYEVHLVDVKGLRFADILATDQIGHNILRVHVADNKLTIAFMDSEWLRQHVPHEDADIENFRTQAVLTYRTAQLKSVVAKYAQQPKAYDKDIEFLRAK